MTPLLRYRQALPRTAMHRPMGRVRRVQGLAVESEPLPVAFGEMCRIVSRPPRPGRRLFAEVVGLHPGHITLMAYGDVAGLAAGDWVQPLGELATVPSGDALMGRVVDAFGGPLDGGEPPVTRRAPLHPHAEGLLARPRIDTILETGVRAIDVLLTLGRGQRVGLFAGSGVGKSSLLGRLARHARADVNVVALVGERGREVREFVEARLGPEGRARSVVVVAAADQPALARVRAAHAAVAIARDFAAQGRHVLLMMDSLTRLAMARREIGLAAGEPATARGYTPSVFAELPRLCERCGTFAGGGSVTALFTVLVEGDDLSEPIADHLRAVLDGHLVLSRELAQEGHHPPIDILRSSSRLMGDLVSPAEKALASDAVAQLALLERNRPLVEIGAYKAGSHPALDRALAVQPALQRWLRQEDCGGVARHEAVGSLAALLQPEPSA